MPSLYLNAQEQELVKSFARFGVSFMVVGGHAVQFHGHVRPAKDLDILVEPTSANALLIQDSLDSLSVPVSLDSDQVKRLSRPNARVQLSRIYNTELLTSLPRMEWRHAIEAAVTAKDGEVCCAVISYDDLVAVKRALGRPQDLEDVDALRKVSASA